MVRGILIIAVFMMSLFQGPATSDYVHLNTYEVMTLTVTSPEPSSVTLQNGNYTLLRVQSNSSSKVLLPPGNYSIRSSSPLAYVNYTLSPPKGELLTIGPRESLFQYMNNLTLEAPFNLTLSLTSNSTFNSFIYNSTYHDVLNVSSNSTWAYRVLEMRPGVYGILVTNLHVYPITVCISYQVTPKYVNPLLLTSKGMPMGLASYGVLNESGNVTVYNVSTTSLLGYVNLTSIEAFNASQRLTNPYSSSIQLNGVLTDGGEDYFVQDVISLNTKNMTYSLDLDVFNVTRGVDLVYSRDAGDFNYTLPLTFFMMANVTYEDGSSVLKVGFVNSTSHEWVWNNNFTLGVGDYKFMIDGDKSVNENGSYLGLLYDAELVVGGGGNGEITTMEKYSGWMALLYFNGSSYVPFPSYYSFGFDTREGVSNVHVVYLGEGEAYTYMGEEEYKELQQKGTPFPLPTLFHIKVENATSFPNTSSLVRRGNDINTQVIELVVLGALVVLSVFMLKRRH